MNRATARWGCVAAAVVALAVRLPTLWSTSLWADELFSLGMATGHSLEHPAAGAVPELGDFVEPAGAVPSRELKRYLEHDRPAAGPARVVRAVRLSDTSPPLYYLALWAWTRLAGTTDAALRGLSLLFALATLPPLAGLARRLGGRRAVAPACLFFALAPAAIHFGTEARMYSLVVLLAVSAARQTLRVRARTAGTGAWAGWVALAAAGLLTHYFFAFVLAALVVWLAARRERRTLAALVAAAAAVVALVAPWYLDVPVALARWRVTAGWLDGRPAIEDSLAAMARLPGLWLAGDGVTRPTAWRPAVLVPLLALAVAPLVARRARRARVLAGSWLAAAVLGPFAFDLARDTFTLLVPRYAIAGLPAAVLLAAAGVARLPRRPRALLVAAIVACWLPAAARIAQASCRNDQPFDQVAALLRARLAPDDRIVVQSIPGGVAGLARYDPGPARMLSWVPQLAGGDREAALAAAIGSPRRIAFVRLHGVSPTAVPRDWLDRHAVLEERLRLAGAEVDFYATVPAAPTQGPEPDPG